MIGQKNTRNISWTTVAFCSMNGKSMNESKKEDCVTKLQQPKHFFDSRIKLFVVKFLSSADISSTIAYALFISGGNRDGRRGKLWFDFPEAKQIFFVFKTSRPALGPTRPPVGYVLGSLPRRNLHLVLKSRISGDVRLLPLYAFMFTFSFHMASRSCA